MEFSRKYNGIAPLDKFMSIKNLFKLESASITEQPVKIPFDFSEKKSIPAGKEVGDSIVIRPITVRTWFKLRPLLLEIDPADLDKMIVKSDEPTSDFPVMMDKYGELLLDIVCLGIHNKPSEPPAWFRNVLIDNSTWEDIRILLNAIFFRIGYFPFCDSITMLQNVSPLGETEIIAAQKNLQSWKDAMESSYSLIEIMMQEYASVMKERNRTVDEDGETEGVDYEWVELPSFDDPTKTIRMKRYYDIEGAKAK